MLPTHAFTFRGALFLAAAATFAAILPLNGGQSSDAPAAPPPPPPPPQLFYVSVRLDAQVLYSDNINAAQEDPREDVIFSLAPTLSLGIGDAEARAKSYARVDYTFNPIFFFENSGLNALQHTVRFEAVARIEKLTLSVFQDVYLFEGANFDPTFGGGDPNPFGGNRDVTGRNEIQFYATTATARYEIDDRLAASGAFRYFLSDFLNLFTTETYGGDLFLDYKASEQLSIGAGGAGAVTIFDEPSPRELAQEARARFRYNLPRKFELNVDGGIEFRQFDRGSAEDFTGPVVDANAAFEPIDGTRLTLAGRHRTFVSNAIAGQRFRVTGVAAGIQQRITPRLDVKANAGYERADYFGTTPGVPAFREDRFYFVDIAANVKITDKWTASAFYIHRDNQTNMAPFGFAENQVGVRTSLLFGR
jgi:hypothetical protein